MRMKAAPAVFAAGAALMICGVGLAYGTFAAGGSDSSCYALMADAFARGRLQPSSQVAPQAPWPHAYATFTPGGFVPSEITPSASAPICAPGFSLLLAPFLAVGGHAAMFSVTPLFGALLVVSAFLAARSLSGPLAGAMAAVLVASSPIALYQVVQPMNDVTTASLWMAAYAALVAGRWGMAGLCVGVALLVRPNLLPLAVVAGTFVTTGRSAAPGRDDTGSPAERLAAFALAAAPFVALVLWFNQQLYGGPLRTGYGNPEQLFAAASLRVNPPRYLQWLVSTHTVFPLLAVAAPFVLRRDTRASALLGLGVIGANVLIYFLYTPFDDWSYLRFLLPAIGVMLVLASATLVSLVHAVGRRVAVVAATVATIALSAFMIRAAEDRLAFSLWHLEQRYRSAGIVVRDRLPANALVLSVWDSGAVRFHAGREALSWNALDPAWLERALEWLREHHYEPFILVESWEEPVFRERFGATSEIGRLDWPPRYEIDRVVRIFDPADRVRYHAGEHVATEYLWPLRPDQGPTP